MRYQKKRNPEYSHSHCHSQNGFANGCGLQPDLSFEIGGQVFGKIEIEVVKYKSCGQVCVIHDYIILNHFVFAPRIEVFTIPGTNKNQQCNSRF